MTRLESWLTQATCRLASDSAAQVRTEILQHYECAREAAMNGGATADEADRIGVRDLGDAKTANRSYRKVLLTSGEARMLREGNWEARALCSVSPLRWVFLALLVIALCAAVRLFLTGASTEALNVLCGAIAIGLLFSAPFLPLYTPSRARVFRFVKWIVLLGTLGLVLQSPWLFVSCLWPIVWVEWTRISIRRKLPVAKWPKQLYL
jgi:hypothetical protein